MDISGKSDDTANYVKLVEELRKALPSNYGISVTLPSSYAYGRYIDPKAMSAQVNWMK